MGQPHQRQRAHHLQAIKKQQNPPPVKAVRNVAGNQQEKQTGQKQRQPGIAQVDSAVRDRVNVPGNGHRLRLGAQNGRAAGQLISSKVTGGKSLHAAPGRSWGKGLHGLLLGYMVFGSRFFLSGNAPAGNMAIIPALSAGKRWLNRHKLDPNNNLTMGANSCHAGNLRTFPAH